MNDVFDVTWFSDGKYRMLKIAGISDLSEFVRNCDAYGRTLISVKLFTTTNELIEW